MRRKPVRCRIWASILSRGASCPPPLPYNFGSRLAVRIRISRLRAYLRSRRPPGYRLNGDRLAFGPYPVRYPTLQIPLGRCLAHASDAAIEAYVNAVVLHPSPATSPLGGADEVADCLREFRSVARPDRRQLLWKRAHERWLRWGFDQANPDTNLFAVNRRQIDYALVGYACECMGQTERDKALDDIRQRLERVEDPWHPSMTDVLTVWNRLLSQMQPYAHAQNVIASGGDWLPKDQYCLPFDPTKDRYLALRYRIS